MPSSARARLLSPSIWTARRANATASSNRYALASRLASGHPVLFAVSLLLVLQLVALLVLALRGALRSWRPGRRAAQAVLLVTAGYLIAASSSTDAADDRYRVPLMPLVCLYAAAGLVVPEVSTMGRS